MDWITWLVAIGIYLIANALLLLSKDVPSWLGLRVIGIIRRNWKELCYLRGILRDDRFARWKPEKQQYVALQAIKARPSSINPTSPETVTSSKPRPLVDILEGSLSHCESVMVLGEPGAGKSTALEAITYRLAKKAYRKSFLVWWIWLSGAAILLPVSPLLALTWIASFLVIWSRLHLWTTPFFLELRSYFESNAREFLKKTLEENLGDKGLLDIEGRCLFLLDGVNEIHQGYAAQFIETWRLQKSAPVAFFACRIGEKPDIKVPHILQTCELDDEGVRTFIAVYLREKRKKQQGSMLMKEGNEAADQFDELARRGLIHEHGIGRNPYWLRMLVLSGLRTRNRGALFLSFARDLIQRETEIKPEERRRKPEWAIVPLDIEMDGLSKLSLAMTLKREIGFEGEENWKRAQVILEEVLIGRREVPADVMGEAEAATLLRLRHNQRIEFTHQLVQEFFTAYALRTQEKWNVALNHCEEPWWWETLFLLGGLTAIPEAGGSSELWTQFADRVLGNARSDRRLFLSIGMLWSVEGGSAEWSVSVIRKIVASINLPLTNEQREAAKELARLLGEEASDALAFLVQDENPSIRKKAIAILKEVGGKKAEGLLISTLGDSRIEMRVQAADALAKFDTPRTIDALIARLNDPEEEVRMQAAASLGKIGSTASETLLDLMRNENARIHPSWLLHILGTIRVKQAIPPAIFYLSDRDRSIRWWSAWALGQIGDVQAVEALQVSLHDESSSVREEAAIALGKIGDSQAIATLEVSLHDESSSVRREAAIALGSIGDARAVNALITSLYDRESSVRTAAGGALRKIGPVALEPLLTELQVADPRYQETLIGVMERYGEAAIESLMIVMHHADPSLRERANSALKRIGTLARQPWGVAFKVSNVNVQRITTERMILALKDNSVYVRRIAAESLVETREVEALESLIEALNDEDTIVRGRAAEALGNIGDVRAIDSLLIELWDDDLQVRSQAAKALGMIGVPAVNSLITTLRDEDATVRQLALEALGHIKDERANQALVDALNDLDPLVREKAVEEVGRIDDADLSELLFAALGDPVKSVRRKAAEALVRYKDPRVRKRLVEALDAAEDKRDIELLVTALQDRDTEVRDRASRKLVAVGSEAVGLLIQLLKDRSLHASWPLSILGQIGDRRAVEPIIATLSDQNESVRWWAARALGQLRDPRALPELERIASQDKTVTESGSSVASEANNAIRIIKTVSH